MDICLIWANARNHASTDDSGSWLGTDDLRRFHLLTERHPVLMGSRTFEAIPRQLLAGRQTFVLTQKKTSIPGAVACTSLHEAFTLASVLRSGKLFLLGGSTVYEQGLRVADRLYVANFDPDRDTGEIRVPLIDPRLFELVSQDRTRSIGPDRLFQEYRRRRYH
ncbi:MAG TPA: dihydrofolate reductase [Burkholderiaceae bacterium]|nr:dihydrofolate reductase [Burkholderiaceae bacterium]